MKKLIKRLFLLLLIVCLLWSTIKVVTAYSHSTQLYAKIEEHLNEKYNDEFIVISSKIFPPSPGFMAHFIRYEASPINEANLIFNITYESEDKIFDDYIDKKIANEIISRVEKNIKNEKIKCKYYIKFDDENVGYDDTFTINKGEEVSLNNVLKNKKNRVSVQIDLYITHKEFDERVKSIFENLQQERIHLSIINVLVVDNEEYSYIEPFNLLIFNYDKQRGNIMSSMEHAWESDVVLNRFEYRYDRDTDALIMRDLTR